MSKNDPLGLLHFRLLKRRNDFVAAAHIARDEFRLLKLSVACRTIRSLALAGREPVSADFATLSALEHVLSAFRCLFMVDALLAQLARARFLYFPVWTAMGARFHLHCSDRGRSCLIRWECTQRFTPVFNPVLVLSATAVARRFSLANRTGHTRDKHALPLAFRALDSVRLREACATAHLALARTLVATINVSRSIEQHTSSIACGAHNFRRVNFASPIADLALFPTLDFTLV